jgi:sec-independent protein translocase protein TatC
MSPGGSDRLPGLNTPRKRILAENTMARGDRQNYSEDMFEETRMSFGEHIEDLRKHLVRALAGFTFFVVISFFPIIGKNVLRFIARPVEQELVRYWDKYYKVRSRQVLSDLAEGREDLQSRNVPIPARLSINRRQLFAELGLKDPKNPQVDAFDVRAAVEPLADLLEIGDWLESSGSSGTKIQLDVHMHNPVSFFANLNKNQILVGRQPALSTLNVQEAFVVYIKVCVMTGFVLASPWVFYQLWSFVAAGLYPHEKKYINYYLPFSIGLFLAGVIVCELFVIPKAIEALLWFNEWLGMEPDLRLNEWLGFAIFMPILFGISFQTPLVMLFLERMNLFDIASYRRARKVAWFVLCVFAAVASPSADALSVLFLWAPMCLLYELGILLCYWSPRKPALEIEVPESEEMVEV